MKNETMWIPNGKMYVDPTTKQQYQKGTLVNLKRRFDTDICKKLSITRKHLKKQLKKDFDFKEEYLKLLKEYYQNFRM